MLLLIKTPKTNNMIILIIDYDQRVAELLQQDLNEFNYQTLIAIDGYIGKKLAFQKVTNLTTIAQKVGWKYHSTIIWN